MKLPEDQYQLLKSCFTKVCEALVVLVERFGGVTLRREFEDHFNARAKARACKLAMTGGKVHHGDDPPGWETYRDVLADMVERASDIAGKKPVRSSIEHSVQQLEEHTGRRMYEAAYRLDIVKHTGSR